MLAATLQSMVNTLLPLLGISIIVSLAMWFLKRQIQRLQAMMEAAERVRKVPANGLDESALWRALAQLESERRSDETFSFVWARQKVQAWLDKGQPNPYNLPESWGDIVLAYRDAVRNKTSQENQTAVGQKAPHS